MSLPYAKQEGYYREILTTDPTHFLKILKNKILLGAENVEESVSLLDMIEECHFDILKKYRDDRHDTLLHTVALFHNNAKLLRKFLDLCPDLLSVPRQGEFQGQTVLHIVISKGNDKAVKMLLRNKNAAVGQQLPELFHACATGSRFIDTVLMGELPLTVAALALNNGIVNLLLRHGAHLYNKNSHGDTVFHSLIKFATVYPERKDDVIKMMHYLYEQLSHRPRGTLRDAPEFNHTVRDPLAIWYLENNDRLTALKLAASLGQVEIFSMILNLDGVYRLLDEHDGVFDIHLYDITEIDSVAQAWYEQNRSKLVSPTRRTQVNPVDDVPLTPSSVDVSHSKCLPDKLKPKRKRSKAVMEIICNVDVSKAFHLININVVRDIIKKKWHYYRRFYFWWMFVHLSLMILFTFYAVYKTKVINSEIYTEDSLHDSNSTKTERESQISVTSTEETFVRATACIGPFYGFVYILMEIYRSFYLKHGWYLRLIHHNGVYRIALVLFSLSLFCDSVWFWVEPNNNYFLVLVLLIGWWFMTFFLRTFKKFSFFTVMFQKILIGDMLRFSTVIFLELSSFSIAMYITFLNTRPEKEEFRTFGITVMTMFKLMLGLTDIEILYEARDPWLAVTLFVLFVLITYVLLINSLIAMMSQTCAMVSEDRYTQWELQRLSVILLLESMIPPCFRHTPGQEKFLRHYDFPTGKPIQEGRFMNSVKSVQTQYSDGRAILKRKVHMRTQKFGELSVMLASHIQAANKPTQATTPTNKTTPSDSEDGYDIDTSHDETHATDKTPVLVNNADFSAATIAKSVSKSDLPELNKDKRDNDKYTNKAVNNKNFLSPPMTRKQHNSERRSKRTQTNVDTNLSKSFPMHALRAPLSQINSEGPQPAAGNQIIRVMNVSPTQQPLTFPSQSNVQFVVGHMTPNSALPQTPTANAVPIYTINEPRLPLVGHQTNHGVSFAQSHSDYYNVQPLRQQTLANHNTSYLTAQHQAPQGLSRNVLDGRLAQTHGNQQTDNSSPRPRVQFLDINNLNAEA